MSTETDWLDKLTDETSIGYAPLLEMINAILRTMEAGDATDDGMQYAGFNGEIKGLVKAMKSLDAKSETIVEAIKQVRRERENV